MKYYDTVEKAVDILAKNVTKETNTLKVVEECAELQEVLLKGITKSDASKPSQEKIVEEMGDVVFRVMVLARVMGVEVEVEKRIEDKAKFLYGWALNKFNLKYGV